MPSGARIRRGAGHGTAAGGSRWFGGGGSRRRSRSYRVEDMATSAICSAGCSAAAVGWCHGHRAPARGRRRDELHLSFEDAVSGQPLGQPDHRRAIHTCHGSGAAPALSRYLSRCGGRHPPRQPGPVLPESDLSQCGGRGTLVTHPARPVAAAAWSTEPHGQGAYPAGWRTASASE